MSESTEEKKPEIFIPPELPAPKARDEVLSGDEFMAISVFAGIKDGKRLQRALDQRAAILRYYAPGETIVVQGDAGETAFYVLTDEDVTQLRRAQIEAIEKVQAFLADPDAPAPKKGQDPREHRLAFFTPEQQDRLKEYYEHEIEQLEQRADTDEETAPPASAWLMAQATRETGEAVGRRARSFAQKLLGFFKKTKRKNAPRSISIDAATDIDPNTMRGDIASGEIFGEMSCLHRSPRSATIVANRPCYMVEMLRNVLDQLHLDTAFRARMREKYVERALGGQLRRLPIFRTMTDEQFDWLLDRNHNRIEWTEFETGDVLFEEGDDPDALYIIHKGLVKVLQHVRGQLLPEDVSEAEWPKLSAAIRTLMDEVDAARTERERVAAEAKAKAEAAEKKAAEEAAAAGEEGAAKKKPKPAPKKKTPALPWRDMLRESVVDHVRAVLESHTSAPATPESEEDDFAAAPVPARSVEDLLKAGDADARTAILNGLNAFIVDEANLVGSRRHPFDKRKKDPPDPRWVSIKQILDDVDDRQLPAIFAHSSNATEDWSQLEIRLFQRRMLELALPGAVPERIATGERRRVLAYLGPGQILGEMGVMQEIVEGPGNGARNATCIAYDHPDRPTDDIKSPDASKGAITRVELLTIRKHVFAALMEACPPLEEHVGETIQRRNLRAAPRKETSVKGGTLPTMESQRFEDLGLVQGQHLMLIDLDRCTRCNACVDACITAHDDGHTRLYLDGPQFQSYLVPVTCRSCLDPVCMIGCPVGSINRGNKGEILIEPWCIGCRLCANQCPYGSIQMESIRDTDEQRIRQHAESVFGELGEDIAQFDVKMPKLQAVVCDLCSSSTSPGPACVHACPHEAALRVNALSTFTTSS